jgi:hypothetical protein
MVVKEKHAPIGGENHMINIEAMLQIKVGRGLFLPTRPVWCCHVVVLSVDEDLKL